MAEQRRSNRRAMAHEFFKRLCLLVGITLALSLVVWLIMSLSQGEFESPTNVLFWAALPHFVVAAFLIVFDTGASFAVPIQVLREKEDRGKVLDQARGRSEKGMSYTFLFFTSGMVLLLLAIGVGILTTP